MPTPRVAVLAHGSGSSTEFLERALGGPLRAAGWAPEWVDDRSGSVDQVVRSVDRAVATSGAGLVGGVSLGAHAVALWAADQPDLHDRVDGLLFLLPAWTGPPGPVAGLSAAAAERVEQLGVAAALAEIDDGSWVSEELATAWPTYGSSLAAALRATSVAPGPTLETLRRIQVPVGLVSFVDDPFHPGEVARAWCDALPCAALVELDQSAPSTDREALGRAAAAAWITATTRVGLRSSAGSANGSR